MFPSLALGRIRKEGSVRTVVRVTALTNDSSPTLEKSPWEPPYDEPLRREGPVVVPTDYPGRKS